MTKEFNGFSEQTIEFLNNLKKNNNKTWFEEHKEEYEFYLLQPFKAFVGEFGQFMLSIDPYLDVTPAVNRTISRIHRDTRFSKDKSPYKCSMWVTFKRQGKDWQDAPGYFFEISTNSYRYGMGFYSASTDTMDKLRQLIDEKSQKFFDAFEVYSAQSIFKIEGEKYKKQFSGDLDNNILEWYQRKNMYFVSNRHIDDLLFSLKLTEELMHGFSILKPIYEFLWFIKGVNV